MPTVRTATRMTEASELNAVVNSFQLFSAQLPIGAFAFSQGLEAAIDAGQVTDTESLRAWCLGMLRYGLGTLDCVALRQLMRSSTEAHWLALNAQLLTSRETRELRQEDLLLGQALTRWAEGLGLPLIAAASVSAVSRYAEIARHWGIPESVAVLGFGWSWLENQMSVAAKSVPLGQRALSQVLTAVKPALVELAGRSVQTEDPWTNSAFMQSLRSAQHETQYSRLFRS